MAKIRGPLFSVEGSGKLNKSIIYSENKGIKTAKGYKVPYNPDSDDQKDQRGFMANAVLAWKTDGYNALDIEAWGLYASLQKKILSGYNMFLRERINLTKTGAPWHKLTKCIIADITHVSCNVYIHIDSNRLGRLYSGTSKYSMLKETTGVFDGTKYKFSVAGLEKLTKYYFYIKNIEADPDERTGIYRFKTLDFTLPPVDIGNEAIDRADQLGGELTLVDKFNPANESGTITKVKVFWDGPESNLKVAIFFQVAGNFLSTRSWVNLPSVPAGYSEHEVSLPVHAGDFMGCYIGARDIDTDETGVGMWLVSGDSVPCTNVEFSYMPGYTMSLKGTGIL